MTINLLDRRNRDTDLAALTSRHNANLPSSLHLLSPLFLYLSKFLAFRSSFCPESWNLDGKILISINFRFLYPMKKVVGIWSWSNVGYIHWRSMMICRCDTFSKKPRPIPDQRGSLLREGLKIKRLEGGWYLRDWPVVGITPITATINPRSFTRRSTPVFFALPIFILRIREFFRVDRVYL